MKELPKAEPFQLTLNGKPVLFVDKIEIITSDDGCTKDKDSDPWPTSYSFTATMECDAMSRTIHRLMGTYRPNRGGYRTFRQWVSRARYYENKRNGGMLKRPYTWKGIKERRYLRKMFG